MNIKIYLIINNYYHESWLHSIKFKHAWLYARLHDFSCDYFLEELLKIFQDGYPMELASGYDGVVGCTYARHLVTAEEQGVLPFSG